MRTGLISYLEILKQGDELEKEKAKEKIVSEASQETVDCLVPLLMDKDVQFRMHIHEILCKIGRKNINAIAKLLESKEEDLRIFACEILGSIRNSEVIPILLKALNDESINVRNASAASLGNFKDERVVEALLSILRDDPWVSFSAVASLGKIADRRAIPSLLNILKGKDPILSLASLESLLLFKDRDLLKKILLWIKKTDSKRKSEFFDVFLDKDDDNIFELLKDSFEEELFTYMLSKSRQKKRKDIKLLKRLSIFKRKEVVDEILSAFAELDPDLDEYEEAIDILSACTEVLKDHISEYLKTGREEFLVPLIRVCREKRIKIAEQTILSLFKSGNKDIKREIIKSLPFVLEKGGFSITKEAMEDEDGHVRGEATAVAEKLNFLKLRDRIKKIVRNDFFDVRVKALKALIGLDKESAVEIIHEFVDHGTVEEKKVYLNAAERLDAETNYPFIKKLFQKKDIELKKHALRVIEKFLDDERYIKLIENEMRKKDVPYDLLKIIKDKKLCGFKERLKDIFFDKTNDMWTRYYALQALLAFDSQGSFEIFFQGLKDEAPLIKISCLKAISEIKEERLMEHILLLLEDPEGEVRTYAKKCLEKMGAT